MVDVYVSGASINIGRQGENEARDIYFNLTSLIETYGDGTATLVHMRPSDQAPYVCGTTVVNNYLVWRVVNTDTAYSGSGKCELRWVVGDTLAKSIIYSTTIAPSLTGAGEVPDPYESWYDALLEKIDEMAAEGAHVELAHPSAYITTNVAVGANVDLTPQPYNSFSCTVIPCAAGDQFTVTGTAGNSGRLWAFIDSGEKLISKANNIAYAENEVLTAPAGSSKLIINVNNGYPYAIFKGNHMAVDRNFKKQAIPQAHLNEMDGVAMPTLKYHATIQQTAGVSGAKTAIFKSGDYFCVTYGENLDNNAGDYPRVSDTGCLAMRYKFFKFENETESAVSYGTIAQKGSTYTDYTGATKTFVGGCGLPSGRQGKQFFSSAFTGTKRYNGYDNYGMTPCVCDVSVSSSGVTFGSIHELILVVNGESGKFDLTRIDEENVNYNLYLTTAPPIKYNNLWHWIQPGKHSLIYLTSPDAVTWTYKWTLPTDFDPCCEVTTTNFNGHILAAVRTWGSNEIKFTSSTLYLMLLNTGGFVMHQYRLPNVSTRSYLVGTDTDALLFYNNYHKNDAECIRITSTGADGMFFHRWFTLHERGTWYITCNEDTVSGRNFTDMYLAGGNDPGPSQSNGMEFVHLGFDGAVAHSPEDVSIAAMNSTFAGIINRLKTAAAWDHSDTVKLTTSLTAYIEAHELGTFYVWSPTQNATEVGAPTTNSYHYEITKVNAATTIIFAYRMTAGDTQFIYVKQKYGDVWGNWTVTGGGSSSGVTSVNGQTGAVVISNATTSAAGLMSATDKSHLDDVYADYSSALSALGVI